MQFKTLNDRAITHNGLGFIRIEYKFLQILLHYHIKFDIHFHGYEKAAKTINEPGNISIL